MSWTAADIPDQEGRTAVVTGANGGLGPRDRARARRRGRPRRDGGAQPGEGGRGRRRHPRRAPGASLEVVALDLGSQASVREAAERDPRARTSRSTCSSTTPA